MDRDTYIKTIKSYLETELKKRVIEVLVQKIPFLGLGFMSPIVGFLVGKFLGIVLDTAELGAFFLYTDFRVSQQGRKFLDAIQNHQAAQNDPSPEAKQRAEIQLKSAFKDLIRFAS